MATLESRTRRHDRRLDRDATWALPSTTSIPPPGPDVRGAIAGLGARINEIWPMLEASRGAQLLPGVEAQARKKAKKVLTGKK